MRPRGGPPGPRRRGSAVLLLLLAVSARLYGALLMLYPEAFRRRYSEEMRRDFSELMREELEEGGAKELVRVLAQAHSDLVLSALKERGTTSASRYAAYLSVDPRIARRAAARAMVAVVLVAVAVIWASLLQTPTYETSAHVLVGERSPAQEMGNGKIQLIPNAPTPERLEKISQATAGAIDSRPVAEEVIGRLGLQMEPTQLLDKLAVEQVEGTNFMVLSYEDTDPERAQQIVNTVGKVSSELISERSMAGSQLTATVWEKAALPESPVSPHPLRNGPLTLVIGLVLCAGTVVALPSLEARFAGALGERPSRWRSRVGEAGLPERVTEQELLEALGREPSGKLTAVEASLETSLSVEEANRMLFELAAHGHLEVTVEDGRLLYSFWGEHGA